MTEDNYLMWLNSFTKINTFLRVKLYDHFGSAENVWNAEKDRLMEVENITDETVRRIIKSKNRSAINKTLEFMEKYKIKYITVNDPLYPELLKTIPDYPLGFFILGKMPDLNKKRVAVVGTRNADSYGEYTAKYISREIASNDVVIVSGMAMGIDSFAHKGAISANGKTIAVLGCGIDITFPQSNRSLEKSIYNHGCIITEYPPGTPPKPYNFPVRNRIISGMSDVVIVVQAPEKSGAILTANIALDHGRTIFAVPGEITNPQSVGTNKLIKDGAIPLLHVDDVLYEIGIKTEKTDKHKKNINCNTIKDDNVINNTEKKKLPIPDNPLYAEILKYISDIPISLEDISLKSKISISDLSSALLMLELDGYIEKLSANRFVINKM